MQNRGRFCISGVIGQVRDGPPAEIAVEASISVVGPVVERLGDRMLFNALLDRSRWAHLIRPGTSMLLCTSPGARVLRGLGKTKNSRRALDRAGVRPRGLGIQKGIERYKNASHSNYLLPMGNRIISIHCFPWMLEGEIDACAQGGGGQNGE